MDEQVWSQSCIWDPKPCFYQLLQVWNFSITCQIYHHRPLWHFFPVFSHPFWALGPIQSLQSSKRCKSWVHSDCLPSGFFSLSVSCVWVIWKSVRGFQIWHWVRRLFINRSHGDSCAQCSSASAVKAGQVHFSSLFITVRQEWWEGLTAACHTSSAESREWEANVLSRLTPFSTPNPGNGVVHFSTGTSPSEARPEASLLGDTSCRCHLSSQAWFATEQGASIWLAHFLFPCQRKIF